MALIFPTNPTLNQEFTSGDLTYRWDGSSWISVPADLNIPTDINDLTDNSNLLGSNPFNQDLNTTDNPQFNRVGLTAGEINVTQGTGFNLYVTPDGETVHNLNFTTAGDLIIGALLVNDGTVQTDTGNTLGLYGGANVAISTDDGNYEWNFDANGDLGFPGSPGTNYVIGESEGGLYISSSHELFLVTDEGSTDKIFRFDTNGDLTIPGSIKSEGDITFEINLSDSSLRSWKFTEGGQFETSGSIILNGQLRFPNIGTISSDEIAQSLDIEVSSGVDIALFNQDYIWRFNADGNLNLAGHLQFPNGAVIKDNAGDSIAFGQGAGETSQGHSAVALGEGAGYNTQGNQSIALGRGSGNVNQGVGAIGIGFCAGATDQGDYAVAIGFKAARGNMDADGTPNQPANSIMINASSTPLNGDQAGLYINPVREDVGNITKAVYYNTTTKELTYADPTGGSGESLVSDNNDITVEIDNAGTPGNTLTWTFGTDGNLTLPRGDIVSSDDISLIINSVDSTSYRWKFNQLGFVEIPNVNNQLGGTIGDTFANGGITIAASEAAGSYVELTNGDQTAGIYVQGDSTTTGANDVQVAIYTNNSGGMEFTGDGKAQLLGDEFRLGKIKSVSGIDERTTGSFSAGVLTINNNQRNGDVRNFNTSGGFPFPPLFTANFTVNLTGFTLQQDHFTTVRVEIEQHSSAGYYPSVLQIDGVAQTINWEGGVNPAPIGGTRDLAVFYIRNTSATIIPAYSVIGHYIGGNQTRFDGDVTGSVFADDSTLLVDGVNGKIVGDVETARLRTTDSSIVLGIAAGETNQGVNTIAIGAAAGQANQGTSSIAIGGQAGNTAQGVSAVALGAQAGSTNQGAIAVSLGTQAGSTNQGLGAVAVGTQAGIVSQGNYAVALGYQAGANNQPANSIVINASGSGLDGSAAGFYVNPVRNLSGTGRILQYDTTTKEVSYTNGLVGDLTGSIFADDSTMLVDGVSGKIVGDVSVAQEWKVTVGPDFYTFNYLEGFGSTLEIPGGIRGKLQTALLTGNDIGISIDGENTPNNVSIGDIANGNTLRIESGSSAGDIILTSSGSMDVRSEGSVTIDINLSDSTMRRWRFGEDGNLNLAGNLQFPNGAEIRDVNGDLRLRAAPGDVAQLQGLTTDGAVDAAVKAFHDIETGSYVTINTNIDAGAPEHVWTFDYNGVLTLPAGGDIQDSTGASVLGGGGGGSVLEEPFESKTSATGVIEHDATTNRLFYHTSISANFTANFTNLGLAANEATSVSLVLVQGATARMVTAVQIGGSAQTITWQGSASAPSGNANRTDVVTFSILCTATDTYTVLGMLTSFGG